MSRARCFKSTGRLFVRAAAGSAACASVSFHLQDSSRNRLPALSSECASSASDNAENKPDSEPTQRNVPRFARYDDPLDCESPACAGKKELLSQALGLRQKERKGEKSDGANSKSRNSSSSSSTRNTNSEESKAEIKGQRDGTTSVKGNSDTSARLWESLEEELRGCPIDRDELGDSTWKLLHTTAANYPASPSAAQHEAARRFIESLALLYPCSYCARDFQESVKRKPPTVESRDAFTLWCCELHNEVNEKLGKPLFPCEMSLLERRWRRGGRECRDQD